MKHLRLLAAALVAASAGALIAACGSDNGASTPDPGIEGGPADDATTHDDAPSNEDGLHTDAGTDASENDGACPTPKTVAPTGETCTGFYKGDPCGTCGFPQYGYVCVNGSPPGFSGCVQASSSFLGETYCCPNNACVAEPDQDAKCAAVSGKPHLYQCPSDGTDGGFVAPGAGCAATVVAASPYHYACCP